MTKETIINQLREAIASGAAARDSLQDRAEAFQVKADYAEPVSAEQAAAVAQEHEELAQVIRCAVRNMSDVLAEL